MPGRRHPSVVNDEPNDREIVVRREFNAPIALAFDAFTTRGRAGMDVTTSLRETTAHAFAAVFDGRPVAALAFSAHGNPLRRTVVTGPGSGDDNRARASEH